MPPTHHVIKILGCNPSNGNLRLDKPCLKANSGDTVQWIRLGNSGVDSIQDIREKDGINDVWTTRPLGQNNWKGEIISNVPHDYDYDYNITWKKGTVTYVYDPKISINPTSTYSNKIFITLITLLGLSSILFFLNKKIRK
jgi:hypothetical protein